MTDRMYVYVRKDGVCETWRRKDFPDGSHSVFHDEDYNSEEETVLRMSAAGYRMVERRMPESSISTWADTVEEWAKETC